MTVKLVRSTIKAYFTLKNGGNGAKKGERPKVMDYLVFCVKSVFTQVWWVVSNFNGQDCPTNQLGPLDVNSM